MTHGPNGRGGGVRDIRCDGVERGPVGGCGLGAGLPKWLTPPGSQAGGSGPSPSRTSRTSIVALETRGQHLADSQQLSPLSPA